MKKVIFVFFTLLSVTFTFAVIINIPANQPNIQAGINASANGDTVLVQPGTYIENIDFIGKNITVASYFLTLQDSSLIEQTLILGNGSTCVVTFNNNETYEAKLIGFTISGGSGYQNMGGGIYCNYSSPTLQDLIISQNHITDVSFFGEGGGGIYFGHSATIINNVKIQDNSVSGDVYCRGGGLYLYYSHNVSLENITIQNNNITSSLTSYSTAYGGGLFLNESDNVSMYNMTIQYNNATGTNSAGGAIYLENSDNVSLENITILENNVISSTSGSTGGGLYLSNASGASLENVTIKGNTAISLNSITFGGGLYVNNFDNLSLENIKITENSVSGNIAYGGGLCAYYYSNCILKNVEISANYSNNNSNIYGGGIFLDSSSLSLTNITITNNSDDFEGSGIFNDEGTISITNSIIWNDDLLLETNTSNLSVSYCDIEGGQAGIVNNNNAAVYWLGVNLDDDPLFLDSENGDYNLTEDSPCIDAGSPYSPYDPDGTIADMGAYYYNQNQPSADFTSNIFNGTSPLIINFSDQSTSGLTGNPIIEWYWDFNNDGTIDSNEQNPQWTYYIRGYYTVSLTVFDGTFEDTETKEDYIELLNSQPIVQNPIDDFSFDEDTSNSSIDLNNVFDDPDLPYDDELAFSYSGNTNIQVNLVNGLVTLIPLPDWFGSENITFTATDDQNVSVSDECVITINPINDPPILNITGTFDANEDIPSQTYDFSSFCSQTFGETDVLTLTADNSTHIDVTISDFNVIFESNTLNWNGTEEITFYLNDNISDSINKNKKKSNKKRKNNISNSQIDNTREIVSQNIQVTVNPVNDPPTIVLPDDLTFDEDDILVVDFAVYIFDIEPDNLTLSCSGNTDIIVNITGLDVTFSSPADWFGSEIITFTVDDNVTDATASDDVEVIVDPVNDPPILNIAGTFEADEDLPSQTYDFFQYCSQTWGETDNLSLSADNSTHIDVIITGFAVIFESNTLNWYGTEDITFYLDDNVSDRRSSRNIVQQTIQVTINPVNDPPTIVLPDVFTFDEDNNLLVDFSNYVSDIEPDNLTLSVAGNTEIIVLITGTDVTFSAPSDWFGSEVLTFTVDDNVTDATASDNVEVVVTPVNDPPVLIDFIPEELSFSILQDSTVTFSVEVEDIDSELNYEWLIDNEIQTETNSEFIYQFIDLGVVEIKSIASDEEYEIETVWSVEVEPGSGLNDLLLTVSKLHQNYPNPFNPSTTIKYNLSKTSNIRIEIYNIKGQFVKTLVNQTKETGYHSVEWNGKDSSNNPVSSGLYLYKLIVENKSIDMKKCLLLK